MKTKKMKTKKRGRIPLRSERNGSLRTPRRSSWIASRIDVRGDFAWNPNAKRKRKRMRFLTRLFEASRCFDATKETKRIGDGSVLFFGTLWIHAYRRASEGKTRFERRALERAEERFLFSKRSSRSSRLVPPRERPTLPSGRAYASTRFLVFGDLSSSFSTRARSNARKPLVSFHEIDLPRAKASFQVELHRVPKSDRPKQPFRSTDAST